VSKIAKINDIIVAIFEHARKFLQFQSIIKISDMGKNPLRIGFLNEVKKSVFEPNVVVGIF